MDKININIEKEISSLIENKRFGEVKKILLTMMSADIAQMFEEMPIEILPRLFRLLSKELAAEVFVEIDSELQEYLIKAFSDKELKDIINELYVDDAVDIIEEMPANVVKRIIKYASPDMRNDINELLKYPEDSVGSVMTTEFVDLKLGISVEAALKHIRKTGVDKETVNTCYITSRDRKLVGTVSLRSLVLSRPEVIIDEIFESNVVSVTTDVDKEKATNLFRKYDLSVLPVVDTENRLVGIVTVDDAIEVMQEEATEDIEIMAAILPSDKPYFKIGILETVKSRIPWLMLLMISATFTGMIISSFESRLAVMPSLIAFIPMLMNTGGNSGCQSSVTIIRGISLGDIKFKNMCRVLWKELRVSLICGVVLSVVNILKIWILDIKILGSSASIYVAVVISLTLFFTVIAAKLVGSVLPLLADKIGLDPAVVASPFITTIVDAISLLIYFALASAILL